MITKGSINKYILFRRFITLLFYQNFVCYSFFFTAGRWSGLSVLVFTIVTVTMVKVAAVVRVN